MLSQTSRCGGRAPHSIVFPRPFLYIKRNTDRPRDHSKRSWSVDALYRLAIRPHSALLAAIEACYGEPDIHYSVPSIAMGMCHDPQSRNLRLPFRSLRETVDSHHYRPILVKLRFPMQTPPSSARIFIRGPNRGRVGGSGLSSRPRRSGASSPPLPQKPSLRHGPKASGRHARQAA